MALQELVRTCIERWPLPRGQSRLMRTLGPLMLKPPETRGGIGSIVFPFEADQGWYFFGTFEPETKAFFQAVLQPGDVFLDIGANVGYFTAIGADRVGPGGKVFAFEPEPHHFARLQRLAELNSGHPIQVHQAAMSDARGTATFFVCEHGGWHSLLQDFPRAPLKEKLTVDTWSLDEFLRAEKLDAPGAVRLAKVDVEGAEGLVVRGARDTIAGHWVDEFYIETAAGPDAQAIFDRFIQAGYRPLRHGSQNGQWVPMHGPEEIDHMLNVRWVSTPADSSPR